MSNFKKLSDAMSFSAEKMKKNGVFETEQFFCDTYCFEPGQEQKAHSHMPMKTRSTTSSKGEAPLPLVMKNESWEPGRSRWRPLARATVSPIAAKRAS